MNPVAALSIEAFVQGLKERGIRRFSLTWDDASKRVVASHPWLEPLAELLTNDTLDFDRHEGFFVQVGPETGVLQGACVHRTCRGQGAGGVRYWRYDDVVGFLRDGLRLSRGMTHKNALAGLWWGGGKGVMAKTADEVSRRQVYEEYGSFMTSLRGCYVTAEDVGTSVEDMAAVFARTRFTTCIPARLGGSGNPSVPTARGVVCGMEAALEHRGMGSLEGKRVAVQGLGHVGAPLVEFLHASGVAQVIGSDIDPAARALTERFDRLEVRVVERGDCSVLAEAVDVVAPCAVGAVLDEATIATMQAPIVCGAANNQLADPLRDDLRLRDAGITYVPDFLVNRMGIVNCADEAYGYLQDDDAFAAHLDRGAPDGIHQTALRVLAQAEQEQRTPQQVALALAEARSLEPHPIWGHRGKRIIEGLVASNWADGDT